MKKPVTGLLSKLTKAKRRVAYSLAAGAAAVATTSEQSAEAEIIYSGEQNITNFVVIDPVNWSQYALKLDLDQDTYTDVVLQNLLLGGVPYQAAVTQGSGAIVGFSTPNIYASNLQVGAIIDSTTAGPGFFGNLASPLYANSQFDDVTDAYIGLKFGTAPNTRFGWIRVDIDNATSSFFVKDWAYESEYNVGIRAGQVPEPTTLGLLAAGAAGVALLRRRKQSA